MHCEKATRVALLVMVTLLALTPPSGAQPTVNSNEVATSPLRAVLYDEDLNDPKGRRYVGSVRWHPEETSRKQSQSRELTARADVEIPERQMQLTWSIRRNTDKSLPASHTIEINFTLPPGFSEGKIANVPGVLMKANEQARGIPLAGLAVKVTDNYFLIGLSAKKADFQQNMQLLKERDWLDIPIVYASGKRAILAIEKGQSGKRSLAEVIGSSSGASIQNAAGQDAGITVAPVAAQEQDETGPLGLAWGSTVEQLTTQGIELKPFPQKDFGETYLASKLPRALSDQETAALAFGYDNKLFRVVIVSRPYENDPSGTTVRNRYSDLSSTLAEKYGKPYSVENLGTSIYAQTQYFLAGINGGYSSWYSNYETSRIVAQLGLTAESSSTGRWRIIFEEKRLRKAFDLARKNKEKGAL